MTLDRNHLALLDQRLCDIVASRNAQFNAVELRAWFGVERVTKTVWTFIEERWQRIVDKTEFKGAMLKIITLEPNARWIVFTDKDAVYLDKFHDPRQRQA